MLFVDDRLYGKHDFDLRSKELSAMEEMRFPDRKRFAVCVAHPFDLLSVLQHVRDNEGSVLLLHGDTPFASAKASAMQAGCNVLIYRDLTGVVRLSDTLHARDPALFQYSSGTTGRPKLVERRWRDVDLEIASYNRSLRSSADEQAVILVPVSHSFGLIAGVLAALSRGTEPVIVHNKNPKFALHRIRSVGKPVVYAVPFLYHLLNSFAKDEWRFHKWISSGAPLSEALIKRLQQKGEDVWQQYGCSEVGCISLGNQLTSFTDVGRPLRHLQVSFSRESVSGGEGVPAASEIVVSRQASAGQSAVRSAVHTCDIGYMTDRGNLHVLGRMDELINVSGLKVVPSEVEAVIGLMRGVKETVVYRARHRVWGEAVKALVVPSSDLVRPEDIKAWCAQHLPAYKVPGAIQFVKEIPKLPSGKVSRLMLEKEEWGT